MFDHMRRLEPMIGFSPFGHWLWLILAIALIALISWVVATAVMRRGGSSMGARGGALDEADAILRARLARGEINADQYAETRRVLGLK